MSALIVIEVHGQAIVQSLIDKEISTPNDFEWE